MKTTTRYTTTILTLALLLTLGGCVKDELHDTPHPDTGKVTVTANWADRGEGVDIPASWHIVMGDYTGTETGATHSPDYLFNPGSYTLAVYNIPEGITVSGTTAAVAAADGGCIVNTPGWLFTSVQEVEIEADTDYSLTAIMQQQVRELTLMIEPAGDAADRIESIEGTLSGAAGTLDFATGTHSTPSEVELHFTKITDGDDAGKWTATVRLLGIAGDAQRLTATLTYTDGNPQPTSLNSDLTATLDGFNDGKTAPLTLGGTIAETPGEAGFTGEISGWEKVDGGEVDAEM
ncbi:MAG: FimB/Mfa2 family fimbrial subunit [Bacteroidetes bacterium]|uniref:FimB/Mfa2 family fimbrial subunit n=1 Tax=Candidatus Cryptobacteroides excrementipullorum TaxID=2840761 RepID=A0A9D9IV18_9BACT|nr:FimB/Mfa2 family fimbrial subunit [Candidatus Cryptobacteroides excrementipullorum]